MLRNVGLRTGEAIWRTGRGVTAIGKSSEVIRRASSERQAVFAVSGSKILAPYGVVSRRLFSSAIAMNQPSRDEVVHQIFRTLSHQRSAEAPSLRHLASIAWRRHAHTRSKRRREGSLARYKSSSSDGARQANASNTKIKPAPKSTQPAPSTKNTTPETPSILDRLPHLPALHRPTKEELLGAATGAWARLKIRFKWFSIRSVRPWNADDISAFFTWVAAGHLIWLLVGTTTFFSLLIFVLNTVFAQETLARWIGNYLTQSSGLQVVFESAVVPGWKDGVISFQNVFVSRRPGQGKSGVKKGSPDEAAAKAAMAEGRAQTTQDDVDSTLR